MNDIHTQCESNTPFSLPATLPLLRTRVTLRLLEDAILPRFKGALLRGSFGYAFQRVACPQSCWNNSSHCTIVPLCPYRWVFETPHPPTIASMPKLRDVPRPFVIEPPLDHRTSYTAGDALEFGVVLIGHCTDFLPYFLFAFEHVGFMGLGKQRAKARLERVEALPAWHPTGQVIYHDGQVVAGEMSLPLIDNAAIVSRARQLSDDIHLGLPTPLRIKTRGDWLQTIAPADLVQSLCWRLYALSVFHSHNAEPWEIDHRTLIAHAQDIVVERERVQWVDWGRTSRRNTPNHMILGGLVGSAVLRGVSPEVRALLLVGSLVHVGKACVFGHGGLRVEHVH